MADGPGWFGDPDGHRDAGLRAHENWFQTRWRHFKEFLSGLWPGGR